MTLQEHLAKYSYQPGQYDPEIDPVASETAYQALVAAYGEDNVWDYRILSNAFNTNEANFSYGIMFNATRRSDDKVGSLFQTGTTVGIPRFYYNFQEKT